MTRPEDFTAQAASYVGKRMLVGLTYMNRDGQVEAQLQIHGVIVSFDRRQIKVRLAGRREGEVFSLPPDLSAIREIDHAVFTLRGTGEVVENPDLLAEWTVGLAG